MGRAHSKLFFPINWSGISIQGLPIKAKIFTQFSFSLCEKQKTMKIGNEISGKDNKDNCKRKEIKEAVFMVWFTIKVVIELFFSHTS
jgi:hypothetical protein